MGGDPPRPDVRKMLKPYISEFVGVFLFLSVIGWAVVIDSTSSVPLTAFIIGMALMVCVYITGAHSGGHSNPAVSLAIFMSSDTFHKTRAVSFGWKQLLGYWFAQFCGAFFSGGICYWMFGSDVPVNLSTQFAYPRRALEVTWATGMAIELMGTMTLVLVVLNVATSRPTEEGGGGSANAGNSTFGLAIGASVSAWAIAGGSVSGGAFNPAVACLPLVWGKTDDVLMYWVGELLGAILGYLIFFITNPKEFVHDNTPIATACALVKDELNEFIGQTIFCMVVALIAGNNGTDGTAGLGIGLILMVIVYQGGHISGGHYNPAVTLCVALRGKCPWKKVPLYWLSQIAGAFTGGGIAWAIANADDSACYYGYPAFGFRAGRQYSFIKCFGAEVMGTFILCSSVLHSATCDNKNQNNSFYGLNIGFAVVVSAYAFGPVSGGAFNPAIGLLPILSSDGDKGWYVLCYWLGPLTAAILTAGFFALVNDDEVIDWGIQDVKRYAEKGKMDLGHHEAGTCDETEPTIEGSASALSQPAAMEMTAPPEMDARKIPPPSPQSSQAVNTV